MDTSGYEYIDWKNDLARVVKTAGDNKSKWGLINKQGQEILPAIYGYIDVPIHTTLFKVFNGVFEWDEFDTETEELFYDFIWNPESWNGDRYEATLEHGLWGLVNEKNETVIPIQYNALEFYSDSIITVNENGSRIIKWHDGDEKRTNWSVVGGNWKAMSLDGRIIFEMNSEDQQFDFYNNLNKLDAWNEKYKEQTVGKYFRKTGG